MPHARRMIAEPPTVSSNLSALLHESDLPNIVSLLAGEAPAIVLHDTLKPPPSPAGYHRRLVIGIISFASAVGLAMVVCGIIAGFVCWRQRRSECRNASNRSKVHHRPANNAPPNEQQRRAMRRRLEELSPPHFVNPRRFSFKELKRATQNFNKAQVLGEGGFGLVFRGTIPSIDDEVDVAVKRISKEKEGGLRGFQAELNNISILRHRNLVQLRGWGENKKWLFLVYEYMANGSLDAFLHDDDKCKKLDWTHRFSILTSLGSAIHYLHVECALRNIVLHRDIKSSNVLLDEDFNAKLGDFGLSRQVEALVSGYNATELAGTRGYMAPEYCYTRKATVQSDVFSYGAVLAEVASGMKALDERLKGEDEDERENGLLLDWMWGLHSNGKLEDAIDKRLNGMYDREEMKRVLVVALACAHPDPKLRPSMKRALNYLQGIIPLPGLPLSKPHYSPMSPFDIMPLVSSSHTSTASSSTGWSPLRDAVRKLASSSKPPRPPSAPSPSHGAAGPGTSRTAQYPPFQPPSGSSPSHHPSSPFTPYITASSSPVSPYR